MRERTHTYTYTEQSDRSVHSVKYIVHVTKTKPLFGSSLPCSKTPNPKSNPGYNLRKPQEDPEADDTHLGQIYSGHLIDGSPVVLDGGRSVTRNVIAGMAQALAGLAPPYVRYDHVARAFVQDWRWAVGAQPWGPYSNYTSLRCAGGRGAGDAVGMLCRVLCRLEGHWWGSPQAFWRTGGGDRGVPQGLGGEVLGGGPGGSLAARHLCEVRS